MRQIHINKKQNAFSLIEVLITLFIVSFAMLGIAKIQLISIQEAKNSYLSNQAAFFTRQIAEQILANPTATLAYQLKLGDEVTSNIDCIQNTCSPQEIAQFDLALWQSYLYQSLPAVQTQISLLNNNAQITIFWDADQSGSYKPNCPQKTSKDLNCSQLNVTLN